MTSERDWVELAARGIQALAVLIMVVLILVETVRWIAHTRSGGQRAYEHYRIMLGKSLLIGLELMVAADIIETAAIELTLLNLAMLGALVIVRTALGWTLTVEVEGHWPWQRGRRQASDAKRPG
jgi:uncharacterized membrane protein